MKTPLTAVARLDFRCCAHLYYTFQGPSISGHHQPQADLLRSLEGERKVKGEGEEGEERPKGEDEGGGKVRGKERDD